MQLLVLEFTASKCIAQLTVNPADMVRQPLVHCVGKVASICAIETFCRKPLLVSGQDFDEPCVSFLALVGNRAVALIYAPFLETNVISKVTSQCFQ